MECMDFGRFDDSNTLYSRRMRKAFSSWPRWLIVKRQQAIWNLWLDILIDF